MVVGGKKGAKLNKTKRGGEKQFSSMIDLQQELNEMESARNKQESSDEEEIVEKKPANPVAEFIEISNPNRSGGKNTMKLTDLGNEEPVELSRRERETLQKEQAKANYMKLQAEGKTDQARADLARLAIIRKQREEAKLKKEDAAKAANSKKEEALAAGKSLISKTLGKK